MTDIRIRPARLDEQGLLEELQLRASLVWEDTREDLLANPEVVELPAQQIEDGYVFVAERDGVVAGFGVLLPIDGQEPGLDGLFVEPEDFGGGVGRALVAEAVRRTRAMGAPGLKVVANLNARGFYDACGFEPLREVPTRFAPALIMRLAVEPDG
ncbi:MAG: GNAT family N-acetyltransferase [Caulobacteraceae bacterium]|nr:GNAT family N-acetyltransferase [Caulobacteraceae bacterium]